MRTRRPELTYALLLSIAFAAGSLIAQEQSSSSEGKSKNSKDKVLFVPFDYGLHPQAQQLVVVDRNGDGSADAYAGSRDPDEDGDIEKRLAGSIKGPTDSANTKSSESVSEEAQAVGDLRSSIAHVEGTLLKQREAQTPWGKHAVLVVAVGEFSVTVDCGPSRRIDAALEIGTPLKAHGLTGVGAADEGLLALSLEAGESKIGLKRDLHELQGVVVDTLVGPVGDHKHLLAVVETQDGNRTRIDLGAIVELERKPITGERIQASGIGGMLGDRIFMFARKFEIVPTAE